MTKWSSRRDEAKPRSSPYEVLRPLARGGMGEVLLAMRQEGTFIRTFAMKRLHPHLREDAEVRGMFLDEARIAGLLAHPHLVSVVDVGESEEGPFLVMDYVEGVSIAALIEKVASQHQQIPLGFALHVARQAAHGLKSAHETTGLEGEPLKLVHRDISPHNILFGYDGITRLTDFGIARAIGRTQETSTGILKGKLGYMSPEQLSFQGQDQRSDLFSFGVTLFELLTAGRLYPTKDGEQTARRILHEPPPDILDFRDDAPPELAELLFQLLAKEPRFRPESAGQVAETLDELATALAEEEGSFDASGYVQKMFALEREEEAKLLRESLSKRDREPLAPPSHSRASSSLAMWSAAAAACVGFGVLFWPEPSPSSLSDTSTEEQKVPEKLAPPASEVPSSERAPGDEARIPPTPQNDSIATTNAPLVHKIRTAPSTRPAPAAKPKASPVKAKRASSGVQTWDW